jgi:hypothetical protein
MHIRKAINTGNFSLSKGKIDIGILKNLNKMTKCHSL